MRRGSLPLLSPVPSILRRLRRELRGFLARREDRRRLQRVAFLNDLVDLPSRYAGHAFGPWEEADTCLLDFNYLARDRTLAFFTDLDALRRARGLRFGDKTLLLVAAGLDPHGERLLALCREFARHHVFVELWNNVTEVVELAAARPEGLYFLPVTAALDLGPLATPMADRPNRRVFVSLGGDDDLDLVREVIARRRDLTFFVPDLAWRKDGPGRREHEVRIDAPNVERVRCNPSIFTPSYILAYARCDTVLVATTAAKRFQMRGGIRVADALRARKRLVMTRNPLCELLMAQHGRTSLVAEPDAGAVADALDEAQRFRVDVPLFEAVRALTFADRKLAFVVDTARSPEEARRSPFFRDAAGLGRELSAIGGDLVGGPFAGFRLLDDLFGIRSGQDLPDGWRVEEIRQDAEHSYRITVRGAGARPLLALLSTAPVPQFFRRTALGHCLSYRGAEVSAEEVRALEMLAKAL